MGDKFEINRDAYPKHIFESLRIEIATTYVKHELRKNLADFTEEDVDIWFEKLGPRDFWNGVHGIAMGFKLKNGMMQIITAENVAWKKEEFSLELVKSQVDGKKWENEDEDTQDPIIVLKKGKKDSPFYGIYDGHRRTSLAIYEGRKTIAAFVGEFTTEEWEPKNFWLPTSFLMDLVENGELAQDYEGTLGILKKMIKLSDSGKHELRERVLVGENEFRRKLKRDLFGV